MQNYTVRLDTRVRSVQSRINPIISILPYYSKKITPERGDAALVFHPSLILKETAYDTYFPALAYRKPGFVAQ